ncbi:MAG: single-stranded DNA-binding protein [Chitinophagales bacterium]
MRNLRNTVQLIGNVGQAPELKTFDSGTKKVSFSLATNESFTNAKGEKIEDTQWHNIIAWGKTAEVIEKHVSKGKQIAIEGKLTSRSYDDKAGNKRYITEIVLNEFMFIGAKPKTETTPF